MPSSTTTPNPSSNLTPVPGIVKRVALVRPYPNPLREGSRIHLYFEADGEAGLSDPSARVDVRVRTQTGRKIWVSSTQGVVAGFNEIPWDVVDLKDAPLGNGLYWVTVTVVSGGNATRKSAAILILR